MSDAKAILDQILHDEKLLNSRAFRDKVYKDEPILKTAAQLKKAETPQKIKEMKGIAFTPEAYWKTSAWLFYTQGSFMADFEDDCPYNEDFVKYYPSYRDLTTEQLRGYFSWRTNVRKGDIRKAPLPFVYIYIYELINCIDKRSPQECFRDLKKFTEEYAAFDDSITRYTDTWLIDMIVYYKLAPSLANDFHDVQYDRALLTLIHWESANDDELFTAISALSSFQLGKSLFYTAYPDEMKSVIIRCFRKLSEFFRDKRKNSLCNKFFGNEVECNYHMFASSIFYDRNSLRNCEYTLNEIHSFTCRNGKWSCRKFYGNRSRNSQLGEFIKAIDSLMREKNNFKYKTNFTDISKTTVKLIQNEIDLFYEEKRCSEARKIEIDLSKLGSIRKAADITRDKLLVDEKEPEITVVQPEPEPVPDSAADTPLDSDETAFMKALLYNGSASEAAKKCGKMTSILADSVNEKLFDSFSDTVIEFIDDEPVIIEDYMDELKEMIPKE